MNIVKLNIEVLVLNEDVLFDLSIMPWYLINLPFSNPACQRFFITAWNLEQMNSAISDVYSSWKCALGMCLEYNYASIYNLPRSF